MDTFGQELGLQGELDLLDQRSGSIPEIEPYIDWKIVLLSQERKESCLDKRGLPQSGSPEQNRQRGIDQ